MKPFVFVFCLLVFAVPSAFAETTVVSPNVYRVSEGVEFSIGNQSSTNFLFTWSDGGGDFTSVMDPTLILSAGATYVFRRTSSVHPFIITDDTMVVTGSDGSFVRTSFNGTVLDNATLAPIADFTADPVPTADFISWTPDELAVGQFYYTCRITTHAGMTGAIEVENLGVPNESATWSAIKALFND